jgi:glycosyltransferase involved in cell wall biosynthesis
LKVGVFIGHSQPTEGGGYTFVVEALTALERMVGKCNHDFVVCHHGCKDIALRFSGLPSVDLNQRKQESLNWQGLLLERYPKLARRMYRALGLKPMPVWDDERVYVQEGIQFVLQLYPWQTPRHNIPYGTVVWDLAHLNWPCFPEVGELSTWAWRQEHFALLVGRASIVYIGTNRGQRELEYYFQVPAEHITVVNYPTPSFAIAAANRPVRSDVLRRLDAPKDYLFYPAQFWAHKNHVVILEACKLIRDQTGWDLGIVFTGSDKGNRDYILAHAERLGLRRVCKVLDFVDQDQLVDLYKGAFCLTYATFFGPDNLPPLEAFALGCPVIASAVPGSDEQLGDAALLFAPHDEQDLARHILTLRDANTRAQLISKGDKRVRDGSSWDDYIGTLIKSLDEFALIRRAWP